MIRKPKASDKTAEIGLYVLRWLGLGWEIVKVINAHRHA
jgi:hypothetical protein